jgi:hypothetical protein
MTTKSKTYPKPIDPNRTDDELTHFHSHYIRGAPDECWVWQKKPDAKGYGYIRQRGQIMKAHRLALVLKLGRDIRPGLVTNHLCGNRTCVNPAHLQEATHRENLLHGNTLASEQRARTHCPRGHELIEENCVPSAWANGRRECLTCNRARVAVLTAARKALGLTRDEYRADFGSRVDTAVAILKLTGRIA